MHRRTFLTTTIATVSAAAFRPSVTVHAQAGVPPKSVADIPAAAVAAGQGPAPVAKEKIARVGIMTLNYNSVLKLPWDTTANPARTLALMDVPRWFVDNYGVTNIELQNS